MPKRAATVAVATPMLAGAGFRDHSPLTHAPGEQRLANGIVNFVRAGVIQIFALQIDSRATHSLAPTLGVVQRRRAPHVVLQIVVEFGAELRISGIALVRRFEFGQRTHQSLGDELSAIGAEMATRIRQAQLRHRGRTTPWLTGAQFVLPRRQRLAFFRHL